MSSVQFRAAQDATLAMRDARREAAKANTLATRNPNPLDHDA